MIFVTVGSRPYPFDRLFIKLDELYDEGRLTEPMFAQTGTTVYKPRNFEYKNYISPEEFRENISKADIVICHGASGSIMQALNMKKKVVAVSRLSKYKEHVNDHQIQNNEAFAKNNYVLAADPELTDLMDCIDRIHKGEDGLVEWVNKDPMAIINMIDDFIQKNW